MPVCSTNSNKTKYVLLLCIYRLQEISLSIFLDELTELLSSQSALRTNIIIAGDFNIHLEIESSESVSFLQVLNIFSLKQFVSGPTHKHGHTLDLVITNEASGKINDVNILDNLNLSDHFLITFTYSLPAQHILEKKIVYRPFNKIDNTNFRNDLMNRLTGDSSSDFQSAVNMYHSSLNSLINEHAPLISKQITTKSNSHWFDSYQSTRYLDENVELLSVVTKSLVLKCIKMILSG